MALAIRHQVPIVPMVYIGGHEGFFVHREGKRIARWTGARRLLRTDTWPLYVGLPWGVAFGPFFHLPLPVKCVTRFLPPFDPGPEALQAVHDVVVGLMQDALTDLAAERRRAERRPDAFLARLVHIPVPGGSP